MDSKTQYLIMSAIRRAYLSHPDRLGALDNARYKNTDIYQCADCKELYGKEEINTDHVEAIGKFVNWDIFISKVFVSSRKLQVLCIECHNIKTQKEMKAFRRFDKIKRYFKRRDVFQEIKDDQLKLMGEEITFDHIDDYLSR